MKKRGEELFDWCKRVISIVLDTDILYSIAKKYFLIFSIQALIGFGLAFFSLNFFVNDAHYKDVLEKWLKVDGMADANALVFIIPVMYGVIVACRKMLCNIGFKSLVSETEFEKQVWIEAPKSLLLFGGNFFGIGVAVTVFLHLNSNHPDYVERWAPFALACYVALVYFMLAVAVGYLFCRSQMEEYLKES